MPRYEWTGPHEWLESVITTAVGNNDVGELASIARTLYGRLNGDDIQDEFQGDMERDGYFTDLDKVKEEEETEEEEV